MSFYNLPHASEKRNLIFFVMCSFEVPSGSSEMRICRKKKNSYDRFLMDSFQVSIQPDEVRMPGMPEPAEVFRWRCSSLQRVAELPNSWRLQITITCGGVSSQMESR